MKRLDDVLESIGPLIERLTQERVVAFEELARTESKKIVNIIEAFVNESDNREEGQLIITYLHSSYVTESHKFKIAFYQDTPFIEEPKAHTYYNLSPFFQFVVEDMDKIKKELNQKFLWIRASEIEEVRRWYMECLYKEMKSFFQLIMLEMEKKSGNCPVFYGLEMGGIELIGDL